VKGEERYLPLYEGKMVQNYDHRAADVRISEDALQRKGQPDQISPQDHVNPLRLAMPSSWVSIKEIKQVLGNNNYAKWFLGFSSVTSPTNARSFIPCLIPESGVGNSFPVMLQESCDAISISKLYACTSCFILDYTARQKIGGVNLNFFIANQFPIQDVGLAEIMYGLKQGNLSNFVLERVLELSYTAWDMQPFALDCGYNGPPFIWDEERRFDIRCELDALFFHLYLGTEKEWREGEGRDGQPLTTHHSPLTTYFKTPRHAVEYIMETFPIVKRKDEKEFGEYRTKLRILEIYDAMTPLFESTHHLPLTTYHSPLTPPPGPPCDADGNFIPVEKWDKNNWPKHIHLDR